MSWLFHSGDDSYNGRADCAIPAAYAELRRLLIEYGYDPKDFEKCSIADIAELISEGNYKAESKGLLESELLKRGYSGPLPSDKCLAQFAGRSIDEIVKILGTLRRAKLRLIYQPKNQQNKSHQRTAAVKRRKMADRLNPNHQRFFRKSCGY